MDISNVGSGVPHDSNTAANRETDFAHVSVLCRELIGGLDVRAGGSYLDVTVGGGGHSRSILAAAADVCLWGIDRDEQALAAARSRLSAWENRVVLWHGNFADFDPGATRFDGIVADLGVSSPQLDRPERGFSFQHEAPLDMRMDRTQSLTAADIVNHWDADALADVFYHLGEERLSRRIARAVVAQRPFASTTALAEAIARSVPRKYRYGRIHPATRAFQALRIAVNGELDALDTLLARAWQWLVPGGKIGIISFHSLEDRRVKLCFRNCPELTVLTKKPLIAAEDELATNSRARSAKLRIAMRVETDAREQ
ncbi:S-adenosyl-methyltransferase MraW [Rubidibacter lacunae KORDI 51-2]|uniref:Ribosomal RNA small subunit methyltransferase H n=1 Tax=Rubidibacter lacunae KORDI 51-2 TaxID=582515 RepID=U5DHK4_9CHRO|nr:S-adenosyl-methyltransferase MraW [Rubidibacter lacunae KORDI 51-2]